ncbi:MAG: RDD family protein [Chitinophagales bacterium]
MEKITVITSQNVAIEYKLASLGDRYVAALIDFFVLLMYIIGFSLLATYASPLNHAPDWFYMIVVFLPISLYHLVCEIAFHGQSFGKYIMKLKVISLDGSQVSISNYLLRWLIRPLDIMFTLGGAAVLSIVMSDKGQRLGDIAAGTSLISLKNGTTLDDTLFIFTDDNYEVTFPNVKLLQDSDIGIIKELLLAGRKTKNSNVTRHLTKKIKRLLHIESDLPIRQFLEVIIKDYNHLNS